jgi:hypothetical protein
MTLEVQKSTQFKVKELIVVTKAGNIDISGIFEEINIFDSVFSPVISGNVLVTDSIGLSKRLVFDGSEALLIEIVKDENSEIGNFKKAFRIYKQSNRTIKTMTSESYLLNFVSDEMIFSDQKRINQSYENIYSEIIKKILLDYLKVAPNNLGGSYDTTTGIKKVIIPNLRPLEAIEWCAKRSTDDLLSPNFLFYQNVTGFNFASLSNLLTKPEIIDVKFEPKNTRDTNALEEISSARSMEVVTQTDNVEKTRSGVNAAKFLGFDPITRTFAKKDVSYADHFNSMKHGNDNPNVSVIQNREGVDNTQAYDSKKVLSLFGTARKLSEYIKKNEPDSLSKLDNFEDYKLQRTSIIKNLMSRRIKFTMPGNFQLSSGFNVNVIAPSPSIREKGSDNNDETLSGKYLIVATRQIIGYDKHETIIEVATTSAASEFIPTSSPQQNSEVLNY